MVVVAAVDLVLVEAGGGEGVVEEAVQILTLTGRRSPQGI